MSETVPHAPGPSREAALFMPAALALLLVLSVVTLGLYRQAVRDQIEERRAELTAAARQAAAVLSAGERAAPAAPVRPGDVTLSLLDADGRPVAVDPRSPFTVPQGLGLPGAALLAETGPGPRQLGPGGPYGDRLLTIVPAEPPAGAGAQVHPPRRYVVAQREHPALAREQRRLAVLTPLVLGVDALVVLLVLLFLRRAFRPWRELLRRAEAAGIAPPTGQDEASFLIATFERALAGLAGAAREDPGGGLALLRESLGDGGEAGLLLVDGGGRVLAANEAAQELIGAALPPGGELEALAAGQPEFLAAVRPVLAGGPPQVHAESRLGERLVGLSVQPLRGAGPGGEPTGGALVLFADLTESRREAERERLAAGLGQLGEMAAGVAHELRNGLATLSGHVQLLARRPDEAPPPHRIAALREECARLERVVADFLAFARPGTARLEDVDLAELVRATVAGHGSRDGDGTRGETPRIGLRPDLPAPGIARVSADRQLLARALENLLRNARQAAAARVEVGLERLPGSWVLTLEDDGPGLPPEVRARLFQPFVTGRADGTGLGLSLAQRIATLHAGRVELHDRPHGGTRAELHLPAP